MKTVVRYGFVLGLICVLAGALLAVVYSITQPIIIAQMKREREKTLTELLPGASRFEAVNSSDGTVIYYKAYDKDDKAAGFALNVSGKGYSSVIETMVGLTLDRKIRAVKVVSHNETPGLGNRISAPAFISQFANKDAVSLSQVQAIAGATISSRAIIESVKNKLNEFETLLKDEK